MTDKTKQPAGVDEPTERRKTPTERYHELAMTAVTRSPAPPEHTVGLTRNAAGNVQVEVTGRGHELVELEASVAATFDRLCASYPRIDQLPSTSSSSRSK